MSNFLDFRELFARWGQAGESLDDEWRNAILGKFRETGRLVASHENFGVWPGRTFIYLFDSLYFSEYKTNTRGPFETFGDAARAIHFFYVTEQAPSAWIATDVLTDFQIPLHWTVVKATPQRTSISPIAPGADGWLAHDDEETPLEQMAREIDAMLTASGLIVRHAPPPAGPQPLVATFHRARNISTKRGS